MAADDLHFARLHEDEIKQEIKKSLECCVCDRNGEEANLYQCSLKDCPKKDKIYCKTCGRGAHLRLEDHKWKDSRRRMNSSLFLSQVSTGKQVLDLMINNRVYSGMKDYGTMSLSAASGASAATISAYVSLIKSGETAVANTQLIDIVVNVTKGITQGSKILLKAIANASPVAIAVAATVDMAIQSYRFWRGDIESWEEYGWYMARSVSCASASGMAGWGGASAGLVIGTAIFPGVGTIIGAIIGGLVASIIGGLLSNKVFAAVWPNPNQKKRERIVREALSWFHFRDDIYDSRSDSFKIDRTKFNKDLVLKQYRRLAKMYHPDRPGGDLQKWHEIQLHLGLLLALCDKQPGEENKAVKILKGITL